MFKCSTNSQWGGVKTPVKSNSYKTSVIIYLFLILLMFLSIILDANSAPRRNSKRAASVGAKKLTKAKGGRGNSKRAATTGRGNSKRAATTGRGNTKRAATTGMARGNTRKRVFSRGAPAKVVTATTGVVNNNVATSAPATTTTTVATTTEAKTEEVVKSDLPACPAEKVVKSVDEKYYNGKKECSKPENSELYKWTSDDSKKYKRGSVKADEAVVFKCVDGFNVKTIDKKHVCVEKWGICPLNEILEETEDGFVSPYTDELCDIPVNASKVAVKGEENTSEIDNENAFILQCDENFYSDLEEGNDIHTKCVACPEGRKARVGAKSVDECLAFCEGNAVRNADGACVPCGENMTAVDGVCVCSDGYFDKDGVCSICPIGSSCKGGVKNACLDAHTYSDTEGLSECKMCPNNVSSFDTDDGNISCVCPEGQEFVSGECKNICSADSVYSGGECKCNDVKKVFDSNFKQCRKKVCDKDAFYYEGPVDIAGKMTMFGSCGYAKDTSDRNRLSKCVYPKTKIVSVKDNAVGETNCAVGTLSAGSYFVSLRYIREIRNGKEYNTLLYAFNLFRKAEYRLCENVNNASFLRLTSSDLGGDLYFVVSGPNVPSGVDESKLLPMRTIQSGEISKENGAIKLIAKDKFYCKGSSCFSHDSNLSCYFNRSVPVYNAIYRVGFGKI